MQYTCIYISYWMGNTCPISLDIGQVCAVFGRVRRTSQIQARRVQCPVILGYPSNEIFIHHAPMIIIYGLFVHQAIQYHWILDGLPYRKYYMIVVLYECTINGFIAIFGFC